MTSRIYVSPDPAPGGLCLLIGMSAGAADAVGVQANLLAARHEVTTGADLSQEAID